MTCRILNSSPAVIVGILLGRFSVEDNWADWTQKHRSGFFSTVMDVECKVFF
jgi:hypothetical protein